ncbi:MAG: type II toxin-antitoxin system ParD family antitoxin [bacterium]|nr:type II toxin-antitoxin system ParD family antitoxin [bacterium]
MNVNLSEDLVRFVTEQTRQGGYTNQSEVVRAGLRLLRVQQQKHRALLRALKAGISAAHAGRAKRMTGELLREIAAKGHGLVKGGSQS